MNHNKKTLETYKKIAKQYAKTNEKNDVVQFQREKFASFLQEGRMIYDFGCGTGRDVYAFNRMGYKAIGFDASEEMLSAAKEKYPNESFLRLNMLEKDWEIAEKPDAIWACASLLHFEKEDFINVFKKLMRLLKSDGYFYFSVKIKPTVSTEVVEGRFFQYYTKEWLDEFIQTFNELEILYYEENKRGSDCFSSYFLKK